MGFAPMGCVLLWDSLLDSVSKMNAFGGQKRSKPDITCNETLLGHRRPMPCADDLVRNAERFSLDAPPT